MLDDDRPRLRVLLDHFGLLEDDRERWRVAHPLSEVLLLAVCGTIGACAPGIASGADSPRLPTPFLPCRPTRLRMVVASQEIFRPTRFVGLLDRATARFLDQLFDCHGDRRRDLHNLKARIR